MSPQLLLLLLIVSILVVRWFLIRTRRPTGSIPASPVVWFGLGLLVFLALTGRLGMVVPIILTLLAALLRLAPVLVQFFPLLHRIWRQRQGRPTSQGRDQSTAEAKYVRMNLDHSTGDIRGSVLAGRYAGRDLNDLSRPELVELYQQCRREDVDSAALLEAYLDRVHGTEWRTGTHSERPSAGANITADQAYQILGLNPGASREAIIHAHRRLMQKLHPDRGGSDYLAAEINRAKEVLLG